MRQGEVIAGPNAQQNITINAVTPPPPPPPPPTAVPCVTTAQCGNGSYCVPQGNCQPLPAITVSLAQPSSGASFSSGQTISVSATTNSSDMTFVSGKTGLVILMDNLSVCQGQGYQCAVSVTPAPGPHTLQAVSYVLDYQGYYPVAQSAVIPFTVAGAPPPPTPPTSSCSSTPQCGSGNYCTPQAVYPSSADTERCDQPAASG